ncbi:MAG: DNA topoisomerase IB [Steroidobacteraceae bacterium]
MPSTQPALHYVSDAAPGITRVRHASRAKRPSFSYRSTKGRLIRDKATLDRINALAIPPAYEDVWICADPRGHLQATGRDVRGRKQYRYHPRWRRDKDEIKHARMYHFGKALPRLRRTLGADLRKPGLPQDKVLALVVSVMDATCARVGNAEYARSNGSFGLTTLLSRHARVARSGVTLHFPGKGGAIHDVRIQDRRLAGLVRKCQHLPGQHLFQYVDPEGRRRAIDSGQLNAYLHRHLGEDFSAKDFRTWHATLRAFQLLLAEPRPDPATERAIHKVTVRVVAQVAAQLRNTPAVCRKSYINPLVFTAWRDGKGPFQRPPAHASRSPAPLLALLRKPGRQRSAGVG